MSMLIKSQHHNTELIPFFPHIMAMVAPNSTECVCSDLQTEDYSPLYAWYNYILIILLLPTLSVFGVCTNIVNVFIYSRKRMQNSANTYLLFLACSDFLVILTGLFIFWIDSARSYIPELARAPYTTVYTLPFGYMAQTCSIYFTVAAAVDCYVNVCWRGWSRHYCTVRRAKQICASIAVCSVVYNSLRFPQFNLRKCFHDASQETIIEICPTALFFTINMVYNVYMYMVLMTLLPFLFLLCLNAIIVWRQQMDAKKIKALAAASGGKPAGEPPAAGGGDDTITMIMVVVLFLACNTLALFVNVIETFFEPDPLLLNLLSDASNFLVVFNSSVNCVIYLIFNTEYRDVCLSHARKVLVVLHDEYFCCLRPRRGVYQPVSPHDKKKTSAHQKAARPSIHVDQPAQHTVIANRANGIDVDRESPVWQPLTQRRLPNLEDWTGEREEEDRDSGCDDGQPRRPYATRWLAEVKIVDGAPPGQRPHIYVKPIDYERDSLSITAL